MCIGRNFSSDDHDVDDDGETTVRFQVQNFMADIVKQIDSCFMSHTDAIHWHQQFDCTHNAHIPLHSTRTQMFSVNEVWDLKNADVWMLMVLGDVSAVAVAAAAVFTLHMDVEV